MKKRELIAVPLNIAIDRKMIHLEIFTWIVAIPVDVSWARAPENTSRAADELI